MALFPTFTRAKSVTDDYWYYPANVATKTGIKVSEKTALNYLTVFACVTLIAGDLARLPLNLYRHRKDGGKDLITDHSLYDLLHNAPNPNTTSFNWREAGQGHLLTWGNKYSYIERDKQNVIRGLWLLPDPGQVTVQRAGTQLIYKYKVDDKEVVRTQDQIFHIPGYGYNGLYGLSMIGLAREAIGLGLAAEEFGSTYFGEGTHPAGVLEMDQTLGDNEKAYAKSLKDNYAGLGKSHNIMILQNGLKYKPITIPPGDSQFLETRTFQKIEICGMYKVPPHKIAIHDQNSNRNNLEQENASYVDSCLMSWLVRWESCISQQLLTEAERRSGLFFEFLIAGLLRGDSKARAEYYNKIFQVGGISPNEIRSKENMNPDSSPEADMKYVMMNMIPMNYIRENVEKQVEKQGTEPQKDETKPEIDEKKDFKNFFSEKRAKEIEKRSIMARDRIAKQYRPLILDAAKVIVSRETKAIKNKVANRSTEKNIMKGFLNDFYSKFPAYIEKKMSPVLTSYLQAIIDESITEIGVDDVNFDIEIKEYVERYAKRHTESSLGQMTALLKGDLSDLDTRADEWQEKRPEKITTDESVRASGAAYSWCVFGAGMSMVLRNRGAKTCPYCKSLNGKRVTPTNPLISAGDELDPKGGTGPMKFYNTKFHVPIHQKCLPGNSNVTAFGITASSENWFDGDLFIIYTAAGNKISCTPNHPILTCHGWVLANEIKIGNHIRKAILPDGDSAIISYSQNMQAMVKDVAKSFLDHGKMIAVPVPTTTENLKSNWSNSKVTIIRADGSLLRERNPGLFHKLREFNLKLRDADQFNFTSLSGFTEFCKAQFPSDCGFVSGRDLLLSLRGGHTSPVEHSSLTLPTMFDSISEQIFIDHSSGNSESVGDEKDGFSIEVLGDEVVRIENNSFHGLVYNLHTKDHLFYADNIVVHNCDCYMSVI